MTCDHCDLCPEPIVLSARAFRRVADKLNHLSQIQMIAIEGADWLSAARVARGLDALLQSLHLCRVGSCPCTGRRRNDPVPYVPPELE